MTTDNSEMRPAGSSRYVLFTVRQKRPVLWYPDRKFFLLGRVIGNEWVARPAR